MKKRKKERVQIEEIFSLNDELFSLEAGSPQLEGLDRRLELVMAAVGGIFCETFTCHDYGCASFSCGSFKI